MIVEKVFGWIHSIEYLLGRADPKWKINIKLHTKVTFSLNQNYWKTNEHTFKGVAKTDWRSKQRCR